MCGIAGLISSSPSIDKEKAIKQMTELIAHRGPDGSGFHVEGDLALGHRRLAILDMSTDGIQPMAYLNRYKIVYNGEIYNYVELKEELIGLGYKFSTKTDTEVILAAYDKWGTDCVGMIGSFRAVSSADPATKAQLLSEGISHALNCTGFGLMVAIASILFYGLFQHMIQKSENELIETSMSLMNLVSSNRDKLRD